MTVRLLGIGGLPGSGKSTLVGRFLASLPRPLQACTVGLLRASYCVAAHCYVLGIYDGSTFGGTDKLAMNVQADAQAFLASLHADAVPYTVIFEGDRLFNGKLIAYCQEAGIPAKWVLLEASAAKLQDRRTDRGSNQDASWLKGKTTKLANLQRAHDLEVWRSEGIPHLLRNLTYLDDFVGVPHRAQTPMA